MLTFHGHCLILIKLWVKTSCIIFDRKTFFQHDTTHFAVFRQNLFRSPSTANSCTLFFDFFYFACSAVILESLGAVGCCTVRAVNTALQTSRCPDNGRRNPNCRRRSSRAQCRCTVPAGRQLYILYSARRERRTGIL